MSQFPIILPFNFSVSPDADGSTFPHTFPSVFGLRKGAADQQITVEVSAQAEVSVQAGEPISADVSVVTVSAAAELRLSTQIGSTTEVTAGVAADVAAGLQAALSVAAEAAAGLVFGRGVNASVEVTASLDGNLLRGLGVSAGLPAAAGLGSDARLDGVLSAGLSAAAGLTAAGSVNTDGSTSLAVSATLTAGASIGRAIGSLTAVSALTSGLAVRTAISGSGQNVIADAVGEIEKDSSASSVLSVIANISAALVGSYLAEADLPATAVVTVRAQLGGSTSDRVVVVGAESRIESPESDSAPMLVAAETRAVAIERGLVDPVAVTERVLLVESRT